MQKFLSLIAVAIISLASNASVQAQEVKLPVHRIFESGVGGKLGTITLNTTEQGIAISVRLHGMLPGPHAFHIHQNPSCEAGNKNGKKVAGLKAGGHYRRSDNKDEHSHHGKPHGDLPEIFASKQGEIRTTVYSKRLTLAEVRGRSIMIHLHGENEPGKIMGGGQRYACGIIP